MTASSANTLPVSCPYCGKSVSAADTFCPACDGVQPLRGHEDYYSALGLPRSLDVDLKAAESRFYELSRRLHPDRYSRKPDQLENAMHRSALLNDAYRALRSPESRLDYFIALEGGELGVPVAAPSSAKSQIPAELAEDYFELQEALMDGESGAVKKIAERLKALENENTESITKLGGEWSAAGFSDVAARNAGTEQRKRILDALKQLKTMRQYLYRMREDIHRRTGG